MVIRWSRLLPVLALGLALVVEVSILAGLDYSKGWLERIEVEQALKPSDPLRLGGLNWDPKEFVGHPNLAPFVAIVREHCPKRSPLDTARCLSNLLADRFAHGAPRQELFEADFSPVESLRRHLHGEEGHCVTRSGIIATSLLASGIPARMVQLYPSSSSAAGGHNVIEVLEPSRGWIFFDPTFGGELQVQGSAAQSAAALLASGGGSVSWVQSASNVKNAHGDILDGRAAFRGNTTPLLSGHLVYPEPWLYTRVGRRLAPAPFNAKFLVVGAPSWHLAFGRRILFSAIFLTTVLFAFFAVRWLAPPLRSWQQRRMLLGAPLRRATDGALVKRVEAEQPR